MKADDQSAVITFLADPASHGGLAVERVDTHAAILFLVGDRVYKLKRAIRLPYLDFSTLAARHHACAAEIRLNQRTAPRLYLGLRAIGRHADGSIGFDDGKLLDWVVEMRRFPADALLDTVAERGALTMSMVRRLADDLVHFHQAAPIAPGGDGAGRLQRVIDSNRRSMEALPPDMFTRVEIERLYAHSLDSLGRVANLLDQRATAGLVRRGHGDLHLANICLLDGQPTPFDGLEFDEELGTTDIFYDLAFLLMDLWARRLRAEASVLLNHYCDHAGIDADEGWAAMPLFLSVRAAVRAHVHGAASATQEVPAQVAQSRQRARQYLALALSLLEPAPARLVAVGGLSGSGKSTLAARLAPHVGTPPGARVLRSDVIRKQLAGQPPAQPLPPESYTPQASARVYRHMGARAARLLAQGTSVIADAVFARPEERQAIASMADVAFGGIWLETSADLLRQRVTNRRGDASDATAEVVDRQLGYAIGDVTPWHRVTSDGTADEVARRAAKAIRLDIPV